MNSQVKERRKGTLVSGKTTCKKQAAIMHIKKGHIRFSENGVNFLYLSTI